MLSRKLNQFRFQPSLQGRIETNSTRWVAKSIALFLRCFCLLVGCVFNLSVAQSKPIFIRVEPGVFVQGSNPDELGRFANEKPFASSISRSFLVSRTEVTQSQWSQYVERNPSFFKKCGLDCPVESVNWFEALTYLNLRSEAEGLSACYTLTNCTGVLGQVCGASSARSPTCKGNYACQMVTSDLERCTGYRLLSESEWEYVARAGSVLRHYGEEKNVPLTDIARVAQSSKVGDVGLSCVGHKGACAPAVVGSYVASPWGHYDFHGNVREWVWDGYAPYPQGAVPDYRQDLGVERVIRGSSFRSDAQSDRVALRGRLGPQFKNAEVGFRIAQNIFPKSSLSTGQSTRNKSVKPEARATLTTPKTPSKPAQPVLVPSGQTIRLE